MSEVESFIRENIWVIYGVFLAIMALMLLWNIHKRKGKIKVRIKTPLQENIKWVKPQPNGKTIIMAKDRGKKPGWKFDFSNKSLVPLKHWWGGLYYAIDVFFNAPKAIEYDYSLLDTLQPKLTKEDAKELNRLDALKRRYGKMERPVSNALMIIILLAVMGVLVLQFISMKGIRIV